jgi:hypothetical protein
MLRVQVTAQADSWAQRSAEGQVWPAVERLSLTDERTSFLQACLD